VVGNHVHTLYVVPLIDNVLDDATNKVIMSFAAAGFRLVIHEGLGSIVHVLDGVRSSKALRVLLGPIRNPAEWRSMEDNEPRRIAKALHPFTNEDVEYVMAVGKPHANDREGDPGLPFLMHPDEGDERMSWIVSFVLKGMSGRAS
jgi:hypothetical protein